MLAPTANAKPQSPVPAAAKELRDGLVKLQPELFGRAMRMTRSRELAEDLVQDTVERAIRFQDQYKPDTNLRAWVHQILFSVFVTRCRRSRLERNALATLSTDPCSWTSPDLGPEMQELSPPVKRALDELPAGFRTAVVLVDIEEMSYKAAAEQLRVPVGTVMSRLHRGRRALADAMRAAEGLREAA
jgi:RNA polymerase sigma-70 factor (ECF subfamily)